MNISRWWRNCRVAAALAAVVLGWASTSRAGYIASNLGTGNSYNPSSGFTLTGPGVSGGTGYSLAVEFQVSGSTNVGFGSAQLALEYHSGLNSLQILLMTSSGGLPGTALSTMTLSNLSTTATLVTATSSGGVVLTAGSTYWLVAEAASNSSFTWMLNNTGKTGHFADEQVKSTGPLGWTATPSYTDLAFAVTASATPAPRSDFLLGVGLISFGASVFRKRRLRRHARTLGQDGAI